MSFFSRMHPQTESPVSRALKAKQRQSGVLDAAQLGSMLTPGYNPNIVREFMHHSKDIWDAAAHTIFESMQDMRAMGLLLNHCFEFDDEDGIAMAQFWMEAMPAVGGRNRLQGLQAGTGVLVPSSFPSGGRFTKMKPKKGDEEQ